MSELRTMPRSLAAIALALFAIPAGAQLSLPPPEEARAPSRLAPLDGESRWYERLDYAGQALALTLGDGADGGWAQYFGGQWLAAADKARIAALIGDDRMAFRRVLTQADAYEQMVLGEGGEAYAALADRPEADGLVCWRALGDGAAWPSTLAEAEDRARHACVRISYSERFGTPVWRAFIDAPVAAAD
jgi:hypothetical protein